MYDDVCYKEIKEDKNQLIPWIIKAIYAYEQGYPILRDETFDKISLDLLKEWDNLSHPLKSFIYAGDEALNKISRISVILPLELTNIAEETQKMIEVIYGKKEK